MPVIEKGQLFHLLALKITVLDKNLSVDITFRLNECKATKRSASDKQLRLNKIVVVTLPVRSTSPSVQ